MAAATTIIAGGAAALKLGQGIYNMTSGAKQAKQAQKELDRYKRQRLTNTMAGMSVPTEGFEMEREQVLQSQAETAQVLSQGGAQSAIAGAQLLAGSSQRSMADISSRLTNAQMQMQQMVASEEARIQQMRERREEQDIAGLGAQVAYGKTLQQEGLGQAVGGVASGVEAISAGMGTREKRLVGSDPTMTPMYSQGNIQLPNTPLPNATTLR